jgi:hypothetical protein
LQHIESCGLQLRKEVTSLFGHLQTELASIACDDGAHPALRVLGVAAWAAEFLPVDHALLTDSAILSSLRALALSDPAKPAAAATLLAALAKAPPLSCSQLVARATPSSASANGGGGELAPERLVCSLAARVHRLIAVECMEFEILAEANVHAGAASDSDDDEEDDDDDDGSEASGDSGAADVGDGLGLLSLRRSYTRHNGSRGGGYAVPDLGAASGVSRLCELDTLQQAVILSFMECAGQALREVTPLAAAAASITC